VVIKKKQFLSPKKIICRLPPNLRVHAVVGRPGVVSSTTNLALQDVQDYYQQTKKEQDTEQQPLARSLLQFAAVHGRTRHSGQRHRQKIRPIRVVRWLSNAPLRFGNAGRQYDEDTLLTISASSYRWIGPRERSGVHRIERPATGSYVYAPVEIKQKGTGHVGEKSVSGKRVYQDLAISEGTRTVGVHAILGYSVFLLRFMMPTTRVLEGVNR